MKKLTAFLAALSICMTGTGIANMNGMDLQDIFITANAEESGTCGDNLTWTLSDDGVLTISGTGNMYYYSPEPWAGGRVAPWFKEEIDIVKVIIEDGVTSIGDGAFYCCPNLTSITVSENNSVYADIDGVLFNKDCTELICYPAGKDETYTIPDSVTSIGDWAFYYCTNLTSITIPDSVTSIGYDAFSYCTNLTSIKILNPNCEICDVIYEDGSYFDGGCIICNGYDDEYNPYFTGIIYGYENSTAQAYAQTYGYAFEVLENKSDTQVEDNGDAEYMLENNITLDFNNDGQVDAKDASMILIYAAQHGAGLVKNLEKFIESQNI